MASKLPRNTPKKRKIAVMLGELCTDISNKLGTFVEAFGNLQNDDQGGRMKRQRKDTVVHDVDDEDDEGDDDYNGEPESEEDSDGDDNEDENMEDEDDPDGRYANHSNGGTGEDQQAKDPGCDLQQFPRKSARLTPKKSHDGPSSNLRKRSSDHETNLAKSDDVSVHGLIQFARKKAEEERKAKLQAGHGYEKDDAPIVSDWSPFSELRELVGSEIRHEIDIPYIKPPEFVDDDGKLYAKGVFMDAIQKEHQSSPASEPPLVFLVVMRQYRRRQ